MARFLRSEVNTGGIADRIFPWVCGYCAQPKYDADANQGEETAGPG